MKISQIEGESHDPRFPGWIEVLSLGFEGHLREGMAGSLVVSKAIDQSSIPLKLALAKGRVLSEVTILMRRQDEGVNRVFAKMDLRDVRVTSSVEAGPTPDGQVLEQFGFSFRQIFYSYQSNDGESTSSFVEANDPTDSDGDGMSDSFEDFYRFDKLVKDGDLDPDQDGFTNLEEFKLGLNPRAATSSFRLHAQSQEKGVRLRWKSKPGTSYRIMFTRSLDEPFQLYRRVTASRPEEEIDPGELGLRGFYRVERVDE